MTTYSGRLMGRAFLSRTVAAIRTLGTALTLILFVLAGSAPAAQAQSFGALYTFSAGGGEGSSPGGALIQAQDGNFYGTTFADGANGNGTVFKMDAAGNLTVLHTFGAAGSGDGGEPEAALIQAKDGNFYGTTVVGGTYGVGTVFKMDAAGKLTVLHSFGAAGGSDGSFPEAALIQARDGNFYGTTPFGGADGIGTVFKMDAAGNLTVLHTFGVTGSGDGSEPEAALIQAKDGNFYGTTTMGGANNTGTVFKMNGAGKVTVLHAFGGPGSMDGMGPRAALIQLKTGTFYGTTLQGGANQAGTVFAMDTTGHVTVIHSFGATGSDGVNPGASLIQTLDNRLYGTTVAGGANNQGTVFRLEASGSVTVVHAFDVGSIGGESPNVALTLASDHSLYGVTSAGGLNGSGAIFRIKRGQGFDAYNDGHSDLLWRGASSGDVRLWQMNGFTTVTNTVVAPGVPLQWQVTGTGDFNADGASDILWRNTSTGDVVLWEMNGSTILSQGLIAPGLPLEWQVAGVGDFNGDCRSDILWRNTSTGDVILWEMNGINILSESLVWSGMPLDWQIAGVGDFNGDGYADILWRQSSTGDLRIWFMDGPTVEANVDFGVVAPEWTIAATGDFNADGTDDLLWRDTKTWHVRVWLMNGSVVTANVDIGSLDSVWGIVGTGDLAGNGYAGVLSYRAKTGDAYLWQMNGTTIAAEGYITRGIGPGWQIDAP